MTTPRARFLALCVEQMGAPYVWGSKGLVAGSIRTFDCSGLVTWALLKVGGPDWRAFHNTDRLWAECVPTDTPRAGTLALYGPAGDPNHVMVHLGEGVVLGASGGGSKTRSVGDAYAQGAAVKVKPHHTYRPDFLGWRELPFLLEHDARAP